MIMKSKVKRIICLALILIVLSVLIMGRYLNKNTIITKNIIETPNLDAELLINDPLSESQEFNILVVEINPIFESITDNTLYPDNDGHPKYSELFGFNPQVSVSEQVKDLEESSHGYLDINIQWEYLNEFPAFTQSVTYTNGSNINDVLTESFTYGNGYTGYRMREDKYLQYAWDTARGKYSWNKLLSNGIFGSNSGVNQSAYSFDYRYFIERLDLINRRNNKEFDQVWIISMDPSFSYETMMVGRNSYWVNGLPYYADCDNFIIGGASMSRRDAQLHANCHGIENILDGAFARGSVNIIGWGGEKVLKRYFITYDDYKENDIDISTEEAYNNLNYWEKFILQSYTNSSERRICL